MKRKCTTLLGFCINCMLSFKIFYVVVCSGIIEITFASLPFIKTFTPCYIANVNTLVVTDERKRQEKVPVRCQWKSSIYHFEIIGIVRGSISFLTYDFDFTMMYFEYRFYFLIFRINIHLSVLVFFIEMYYALFCHLIFHFTQFFEPKTKSA